jgi:hypothetical protein
MTQNVLSKHKTYTPEELKMLFEALNQAPSYLSKRFILKHLLHWTDDDLAVNMQYQEEENRMKKMGKTGAY